MGTLVPELIEKCRTFVSTLAETIRSHLKIALIIAGAFLVIILLLLVLAVVTHQRNAPPKEPQSAAAAPGTPAFPAEDFFLPYEPDFVPDVLLEREPRDGWTEEDARPFWTDPMEGNEETWRRRIESGVDALLEHVP